jgi:hypothetical protein
MNAPDTAPPPPPPPPDVFFFAEGTDDFGRPIVSFLWQGPEAKELWRAYLKRTVPR